MFIILYSRYLTIYSSTPPLKSQQLQKQIQLYMKYSPKQDLPPQSGKTILKNNENDSNINLNFFFQYLL